MPMARYAPGTVKCAGPNIENATTVTRSCGTDTIRRNDSESGTKNPSGSKFLLGAVLCTSDWKIHRKGSRNGHIFSGRLGTTLG